MKNASGSNQTARLWTCALMAMLAAGLVSCSRQADTGTDTGILARVNGQPVTETTFRYEWAKRQPGTDSAAVREEVLERLIQRAVLVQQAQELGLDSDPVILDAMESLLINRLEELQLQPRLAAVAVSPEEVRTYYEEHLESKFSRPEQRRPAVLWFDTRGQAPLAARYRPRLETARAAVLDSPDAYPVGKGFGKLAIQNSEHRPSRYKGGDLGWLQASDQPGLLSAVFRIASGLSTPGEISPVVEAEQGLFVVRLIEIQPARVVDLGAVEEDIRHKLRREKQEALRARFYADTTGDASINRYPEQLNALTALESPSTFLAGPAVHPSEFQTPQPSN